MWIAELSCGARGHLGGGAGGGVGGGGGGGRWGGGGVGRGVGLSCAEWDRIIELALTSQRKLGTHVRLEFRGLSC